jgi:CdiI immunity protein
MDHHTFQSLYQVFSGYLNQDWSLDYPDEAAAIADLVASCGDPFRQNVVRELDELLGTVPDEQALERIVCGLGAAYDPLPAYGGYRPWLLAIRNRFVEARRSADESAQ